MVVILLWAKYFGPKPPVNSKPQNPAAQTASTTPGKPGTPSESTPGVTPPTASAATTPAVPATAETQERTIVVENALYRVEFSNRGAVVKSWQLKKYKDDAKPPQVLDVVHPQASSETGGWPMAVVLDNADWERAANGGLYETSAASGNL